MVMSKYDVFTVTALTPIGTDLGTFRFWMRRPTTPRPSMPRSSRRSRRSVRFGQSAVLWGVCVLFPPLILAGLYTNSSMRLGTALVWGTHRDAYITFMENLNSYAIVSLGPS